MQQIIDLNPPPVVYTSDLSGPMISRMVVEADVATQPLPQGLVRDLIGSEVFFVLSSGFNVGQRRPAVVVRDWGNDLVNLQVFADGFNDFAPGDIGSDAPFWATSVAYAPGYSRTPGTWHWRMESF